MTERKRTSSIASAVLILLLGGAVVPFTGCGSMPKEEVRERVLALEKNRPIREEGLSSTTFRADLGAGERDFELVYLRAPATRPGPGAEPVLLIHGTPSTLSSWVGVVYGRGAAEGEAFDGLRAERDVYALELIGHGYAPGSFEPYSFDSLARFVVAAVEAIGLESVHLVGHSYGGEVAWRAALLAPELFRSLTLSDSSGYTRPADGWLPEEEEMREHWLADIGWRLNSPERIRTALAPHFAKIPEGSAEEFFLVCENADNWHAMIDLVRDENGESEGNIPELALPTLILWGEKDIAYPLENVGQRFAEEIPGAELRTIETGHYPHEERPRDYVRELNDFLNRVDGVEVARETIR